MPISADEFRTAMGLRASGVSIVTARAGDDVHGMTMTDFAGVSLVPPLALVCADKSANTLKLIQRGGNFGRNRRRGPGGRRGIAGRVREKPRPGVPDHR